MWILPLYGAYVNRIIELTIYVQHDKKAYVRRIGTMNMLQVDELNIKCELIKRLQLDINYCDAVYRTCEAMQSLSLEEFTILIRQHNVHYRKCKGV